MKESLALVLVPFGAAYFLSYFVRSLNALIAPELGSELGIGAAGLGLLTGGYFFASAFSQVPLGILFDRFGVGRVQGCALGTAAVGAALFAAGDGMVVLTLGRALVGVGVSGCLMAAFTLLRRRLPAERLTFAYGAFMAAGGLGALASTMPAELLLGVIHWRGLFLLQAAAFVVLALAVWRLADETPSEGTSVRELFRGLFAVYRSPIFWRLAPVTVAGFGVGSAIQGLWAGPWLADVAGLPRAGVAAHLMVLTLALTAGSLFAGLAVDRIKGLGTLPLVGWSYVACLLVQVVLLFDPVSWSWVLWGLFGLTYNNVTLTYSVLTQAVPKDHAGRVNTALNVLTGGGSFVAQYGLGAIIGLWAMDPEGGYPPAAYHAAFGAALVVQVVAFLWFLRPVSTQDAAAAAPHPGRGS